MIKTSLNKLNHKDLRYITEDIFQVKIPLIQNSRCVFPIIDFKLPKDFMRYKYWLDGCNIPQQEKDAKLKAYLDF